MKIREVERDGKKLKIELENENVTFAHSIRKQALQNPNIDVIAAIKRHPYISNPQIVIKTKKGNPETVLADAAEKLAEICKDLRSQLK